MTVDFDSLASRHGFAAQLPILRKYLLPCIGFSLQPGATSDVGASRLGGGPDLPPSFSIPTNGSRPLDFLLQVNLKDLAPHDKERLFPADGLLSFFYDLEEQPWGFDPANLGGYRVLYFPGGTALERVAAPHDDVALKPCRFHFWPGLSLPYWESPVGEFLAAEIEAVTGKAMDLDPYLELVDEVSSTGAPSAKAPAHRFGGHSINVQGDMQLEAQLVMNGLSCGDERGYRDPRARKLKETCHEWRLLLELDSDDAGEFMWGDGGMLYYWARRADIQSRDFTHAWMTLQCG